MADAIPIKERIVRQIVTNLGEVATFATVRRWTGDGRTTVVNLDVVVVVEDETAAEGPQGTVGYTDKRMALLIAVVFWPVEGAETEVDTLRHRYQGLVETALTADPYVVEAETSQPLAYDLAATMADGPDFAEGSVSAAVRCTVSYRHDRTSVYTLGTLITEQTE